MTQYDGNSFGDSLYLHSYGKDPEAIKFRNSEFNKLNPNYESIFNQFEAIRKEAATDLNERRIIASCLYQMDF